MFRKNSFTSSGGCFCARSLQYFIMLLWMSSHYHDDPITSW